jgi:uncharacterized protein
MRIISTPWRGMRAALVLILVALSGACSWQSAPVHFYVLDGARGSPATSPTTPAGRGSTIGVGPVTLPRYLERNNIVTRQGTELVVAEYDRWGEPLSESVPRLIAADLATLLGTERIVMFPWPVGKTVDQQLVVDVLRFEGTSGGDVVLEARWRVLGPDKQEVLLRHSVVREPGGGSGYPALVAAMSRSVEGLSREIADAVKRLRVSSAPRGTRSITPTANAMARK